MCHPSSPGSSAGWKANSKCSESAPRQPPTFAHKLVECCMQGGCVCRFVKRSLIEPLETGRVQVVESSGSHPVATHRIARASAATLDENAAPTQTKPSRTKRAMASAPSAEKYRLGAYGRAALLLHEPETRPAQPNGKGRGAIESDELHGLLLPDVL